MAKTLGTTGDNVVWGTMYSGDNVVWGTSRGDNVVWGTACGDNVVWGTAAGDNVVWGTLVQRRQRRLGHGLRRRQHRVGHRLRRRRLRQRRVGRRVRRRQHRLGHGRRRRQRRVGHVDGRQHRLGARPTRRRRDLGQQRRRSGRLPGRERPSRCRASTSSSATWCRSCPSRRPSSRSRSSRFPSEASNHGKDALPQELDTLHSSRSVSRRPATRWSAATGGRGCRRCAASRSSLRELRASDAASLFALLTTEEVSRFISPPPSTVEGFERFIAWTLRQRAGRHLRVLRGDARRLRHGDRHLPDPRARARLRHRRMGLRHRVGVLGHGRVPGRRGAGARLRVRHDWRASPRSARGGPERPRQRRAAEDRRRAGSACCASRSSATASISTRCSTRSSTSTGASRARRPGDGDLGCTERLRVLRSSVCGKGRLQAGPFSCTPPAPFF